MSAPPPLVGRLAPSPTGRLHLGHARSFLLAWWSVRSRGGRLLLRIEDLDHTRVRPGAVDEVLRDLAWLGLDWDGEPVLQSSDTTALEEAARRLVDSGHAYPCVCSRREVEAALSAPHRDDVEQLYPGTCRDRFASLEEAERTSGRPAGIRFRAEDAVVRIEDALAGPFEQNVGREVGDFWIARRDRVFAYQLAVVVDDARMGVTEVLRGDDLLPSTPRQALLADALGLPRPTWLHVPLVLDHEGRRLAKRDGSLGLSELRARGVDARRVVAWVARTCGFAAEDLATPEDLLGAFELAALPREPLRLTAAERERIGAS